ncbi:hypothetical protein PAESOLCIP111_00117 [Paenibacillus solanacearum]|uniref:Uncharacterized protein n=1 Tax=Paenibacillus solanacearum TaxID=2048548 RepID=A0A916NKZ2_9BACL|nr:hypothetical protein PAESOLCIP111_00117 [Paenibacillus solanacearum]
MTGLLITGTIAGDLLHGEHLFNVGQHDIYVHGLQGLILSIPYN